ncbi:MAG: glycosyltransferase family 39 protein [Anaerolineae bacterium]|nr:glycosyltransferase family 39 protein [Anaerolineae bacterium]
MAVSQAARRLTAAAILLVAFGLIGLLQPGLSAAEADALWAVQDSQRPPDSLSQFLRQAQSSLTQALSRARESGQSPLYILPLDAWTQLVGVSVFSLRLLSALVALLLLALTKALASRWVGAAGGMIALVLLATSIFFVIFARQANPLLLVMPLLALLLAAGFQRLTRLRWIALLVLVVAQWIAALALLPPTPDWGGMMQTFSRLRQPTEPAVSLVPPREPLHYYLDAAHQGIILDLGWREQTPESLERAVTALEPAPVVWAVLLASESDLLDRLEAAGFTADTRLSEGDVQIYRLTRDEAPR